MCYHEEAGKTQQAPGNVSLPIARGVHYLDGHILCRGYGGLKWDGQLSLREKEIPTNRRLIVMILRGPRRETPVSENNSQINCQSTQFQVQGKSLFQTAAERSGETYNLFRAHTSLPLMAAMGKRPPARFSPRRRFPNWLPGPSFGYRPIYFVTLTCLVTQTCIRLA